MRIEVLREGETVCYGHVDADGALVVDEWVNGWCGMDRMTRETVDYLARNGRVVFRQDNTIPHDGVTMTRGDGSTMRFGPGRMRITRLP